MAKWDGLNRRQFPRVFYPCLVKVKTTEGGKAPAAILTHTENVGRGGVCVILKEQIKVFTPVELELDVLDLGAHIKCNGKVVWSVRRKQTDDYKPLFYDIGIEFDGISLDETRRLDDVVVHLVKQNKEVPYN